VVVLEPLPRERVPVRPPAQTFHRKVVTLRRRLDKRARMRGTGSPARRRAARVPFPHPGAVGASVQEEAGRPPRFPALPSRTGQPATTTRGDARRTRRRRAR
jgi:hypothetical protein